MDKSSPVPGGPPAPDPVTTMTDHRHQPDDAQKLPQPSPDTSNKASPLASREPSPGRNPRRTTSASRLGSASSRKSSHNDISPTRQSMRTATTPVRAPPSRSLSSTTTPSLPPASQEPTIQSPTPQKPGAADGKDNPRWPVSPRLRSPPPQLASNQGNPAARRGEQESPAVNVPKPTAETQASNNTSGSDTEDSQLQSGIRTPARGSLETVQEVSLPSSPSTTGDAALMARVGEMLADQQETPASEEQTPKASKTIVTSFSSQDRDSGSDTGGSKADQPHRSTPAPPPTVHRQPSAMLRQTKTKQENPSQNMTVETETVTSIPQVALATGSKSEGTNGTLKPKPSTETIKPKKEKKKASRKQPAVSSGNGERSQIIPLHPPPFFLCPLRASFADDKCPIPASSKSDIFEAKIASAVDEANTSDSEETFVYDSNPPDGGDRSARRFHSRTPSTTSMASQADRQNLRSIYGVMEAGPHHGPRKGMKFVNTANSNGGEGLNPEDDGKGTGRSVGGSARGTTRHHHIGRWGRQPGNGHASLFDTESPFPNAAKSKFNGQSRNSSGPPSPRTRQNSHSGLSHKRSNYQMSNYDADDNTAADDERTPLVGSARRTVRGRRGPHSLRQAESQRFERRPSYLNRFAACLVLTMMLLLVITGAIGLMFATSQPMSNIEIVSMHNVVTSEQVLMFDLTVKAHNPNIVVITVDEANLEIFAKSEHAGTDSDWWKTPHGPDDLRIQDDPANDPPLGGGDEDEDDSRPNVLLGRITEFDSPLTFEGSLFHQGTSSSTGQMQLAYPGNGTSGGSERWERIYQDEFDLIVKGVVKYTLPLSARVRSATVAGRKVVKPNSANDPSQKPNSTIPDG